ncbi:adenylosuccinate lyase [Metabacillus arenae]|uniref:Adenylosuccinate lyase n=1 Tax=Metabacillus arenae TaxID=2771434 RepID=A0A926RXE4_9BACI|nr:adenylosuccinate lyase [Metabacillus arenae]MBD1381783.1 adenylosuccinate lyase [Metabacillus arenae]
MASHIIDMLMTRNVFGTEEMRNVWSEENRTQKHLDVEAALALSEAEERLIPEDAAKVISEKAKVEFLNLEEIAVEVQKVRHALTPTVNALQNVCGPGYGEYVHYGVTTQDVIDTGVILQLKEAHQVIVRELQEVASELARLAREHRETPMAGRTHGVQGIPTTFGFKLSVLLNEVIRHLDRLRESEARVFTGVLSGAVGTFASFGPLGQAVERRSLEMLGLAAPDICWHSSRDRVAEYISILGMISATLAKMGNEFYNLMRTEIDELEEPFTDGKVGSSTMPHKRNPSAFESLASLAKPIRYNVAMAQESMIVEHERELMAWRGEWILVSESCIYLSFQLSTAKAVLSGLVVKPTSMEKNLNLMGGLMMSERVMFALGEPLGKQTAHHVVYEICMKAVEEGRPFRDVLLENEQVREAIAIEELEHLLDPMTYLGSAPLIVDQVVEKAEQSGWLEVKQQSDETVHN